MVGQTQIIHFKGGTKRTIEGVIKVYENEMVHLLTADGFEWIINKQNVLCIEVLPQKVTEDKEA